MNKMMTKLSKEINIEDFLIRIRPFSDDDGRWSESGCIYNGYAR